MTKIKGWGVVRQERAGRHIGMQVFHNGTCIEGINTLLASLFQGIIPTVPWYFGLINDPDFSNLQPSDTLFSHPGWQEAGFYNNRIAWVPVGSSLKQQSISANSFIAIPIAATGIIAGVFLTNDPNVGGTSGVLWATATFGSSISVITGDIISLFYNVQLSDLSTTGDVTLEDA